MRRSPGKPVIEFDHLSARYAADPLRFPNRHISFGVGAHRCIGSTLARAEFGVIVREILLRMPDYALGDGAVRYSNIGTANGWHRLPARFTPGRRTGAPAPGSTGRGAA